jgi:hypothetical protein
MNGVAAEPSIDLVLRVVRTDTRVRGTLAGPSGVSETFEGWLDLTAAVVRVLDATPPTGADGRSEPPRSEARR